MTAKRPSRRPLRGLLRAWLKMNVIKPALCRRPAEAGSQSNTAGNQWRARHHPHPTLPHRGGGLLDDARDRRGNLQTHVVFIECRAKPSPSMGEGWVGVMSPDSGRRRSGAAGDLDDNRASRHATSTYWEPSIHFEPASQDDVGSW